MVYTPGESFAGYTIERLIGRGGMGEVYLAKHPSLPRKEAVKILPADLSRDPMFRRRFIREAELASSIVHPSIVTIYNSGEHDGHLWLAMEYIDGVDAGALLGRRPGGLDPAMVSAIATSVASALDAAHAHGLLHRDVKPANILVEEAAGAVPVTAPRVLLADFGIAKSQQDVSNLTSANVFLGTVAYVAPEQLLGTEIDGRADQYSLAATLFQLLCGRPPFEGNTQTNVVAAHLNSAPPVLSSVRSGTSPAVDAVFERALRKSPDERYRSCGDLAADLVRALGQPSAPGAGIAGPGPTEVIPTAPTSAGRGTPVYPYPQAPYGQASYGQAPYPQAPYVPSGHPGASNPNGPIPPGSIPPGPMSAPFGATGPYGQPIPVPPKKSSKMPLIVVAVVVALVVVVGAGILVANALSGSDDDTTAGGATTTSPTGAGTSPATPQSTPFTRPPVTQQATPVSSPDQLSVGDCVQFGRQRDSSGNVPTERVDCATPALTFYAARFVSAAADCPNERNASLTFDGSSQKLCLTPNFVPDECYQIPRTGGSLADYHEIGCSASPLANTVVVRVTGRSTSQVTCSSSETRWTFEIPESLGYCLEQIA
ncbi:protein kinase [Gordonia desulfuricans]|uniref:non-specific serine/threonine protein kinase n=1 Tax=Gordonia desulfuricans TaxID=89051 RepID=A0A7K3LU67_9ACTN|nr:serine/threonine-protein kinase [Gordonia desulfuricans]NDK91835.1 protein kinase [Gordonia desulfuricans]